MEELHTSVDSLISLMKSEGFRNYFGEAYDNVLKDLQEHPGPEDFVVDGVGCRVARNFSGNWCGYVTAGADDEFSEVLQVHGGVTYNDGKKIGFDTCHMADLNLAVFFLCPGFFVRKDGNIEYERLMSAARHRARLYKDHNFVVEEVKKLAGQLGPKHRL